MAQWLPSDNPNSAHQTWSRWAFLVETPRMPPKDAIVDNARRYFAAGFRTQAGRIHVTTYESPRLNLCSILCEAEGPPVNDSAYQDAVLKDFTLKFLPGFGPGARVSNFTVTLLAGSPEDGRPATQLLVLPPLVDGVKL